jgi:hypothetical protein
MPDMDADPHQVEFALAVENSLGIMCNFKELRVAK